MPSLIGVAPFGQAIAIAGHATGLLGSQTVLAGTHWPVHVMPEQFPFASHEQLGSVAGQAQIIEPPVPVDGSGGVVPVVVVPPELQPQPPQLTWHIWPVGQSVSALQPVWMF